MLFSAFIFAGIMHAEETVAAKPVVADRLLTERPVAGRTLWRVSAATLVAAHAMDIHSSWGKHELNPTLRGPSGTFGHEGTLIKVALTGGLMGIEYLIARRNPNSRIHRAFAMINFGAAGAVAGTAMRNYSIARPR